MDHSSHEGGMGGMSMGDGVPSLFYIQKIYWATVGAAIAFGTMVNVLNKALALQRYRSQRAKPQSPFWVAFATGTAIGRELSNYSVGTLRWGRRSLRLPTMGRSSIALSNLTVLLVLCFYKLDTLDVWTWEDVGYRIGFVSIAQLPLIVLLAGKDNLIGLLTGFSYERLNWLHRWTARTLWLTATLHMGFWFRSWARYDYIKVKLTTDPITSRGFAAWCILSFIVATSIAPIRRFSYELFVVSHLITFAGFIAVVWLHVPAEVKIWVWLPIAFFVLDRLLRTGNILYLNLTPFHFWKRRVNGVWANLASFQLLPGGVTRISIHKPALTWGPGQHVFLSCHSLIPLQSHPFTIASLPSDEKLEILVKAQRGGTKKFLSHASKCETLPAPGDKGGSGLRKIGLEGPYGRVRDLGQFDSVVFFAGSIGATFTVPHMRHLVRSWHASNGEMAKNAFWPEYRALTRKIRFVWVVRSRDQLGWFQSQLQDVIDVTNSCSKSHPTSAKVVEISVYVTCDDELVAEKNTPAQYCEPLVVSDEPREGNEGPGKQQSEATTDLKDTSGVMPSKSANGGPPEVVNCVPDGPLDGSCCCKAVVDDEANAPVCCCSLKSTETSSKAPSINPVESDSSATSSIRLLSGRPQPRTIIRKVLEEAKGESAVVVCGPDGLRDDIRASVVRLSDERAVHKGTGAQGIYLHIEGFGY